MLAVGPATKITIHVNQDTSSRKDFLHIEILTFLYERGVSCATVVKIKIVNRYLAENTPNPFASRKIAPISVF